ncbi:type 4 pilus major pilin [Chromobacterium violaceum]|uniref:type 4 pilus major pilin n=1 Tax=Chromobacterium violaceum TaxID=536 RepID=UPI0009BBFB11|nr:type 4 pilus major pilin [Chromobacterium violaceum]
MTKDRNCKERLRKQSGFTLIEALVVMIVGVVVLATAAAGMTKLFRASEISTEAQDITSMAASLKSLKSGTQGYVGLDTKMGVQMKIPPQNMLQDASTVKNVWGGAVEFGVANDTSGNVGQAFTIAYKAVPAEACGQLAQKLRGAGFQSISVGDGDKTVKLTPVSTLAEVSDACKGDTNTMTFTSDN